jgi:hypothetical protein
MQHFQEYQINLTDYDALEDIILKIKQIDEGNFNYSLVVDENNFRDDKKITGALNLVLQHTSLQYGFVIQVCRLYNTSKITWHAQIFKNVSAIVDLLGGCGINIQFIIMDAHTAHNNVFYNQDIIKIGDKQIKVIRDAFHLIKNFGNILLRKEALYFDGTKFILQGNYSKN